MGNISNTWLQARIDNIKLIIEAMETAMVAIESGDIETYTLDTGQSRQTVTRTNLAVLKNAINSQYNLLDSLDQRLTGEGSSTMIPDF